MEKTKIYDQIYLDHGLKHHHIMTQLAEMKIEEDDDVKEI